MTRHRLTSACLLLTLALGGCQLLEGLSFGRGGRAPLISHVTPVTQPLMYPGEVVRFELNASTPLAGTAKIALRHQGTDETRIQEVPAPELGDFTLKLATDELPGYEDNALNRYRLSIATKAVSGKTMETGGGFWVVSDRSIQPPPKRRIASGIGYPESWTSGGTIASMEALADEIARKDWGGQELTMTRRELPRDERPSMPRVPDEAVLWEFLVTGEFPKYALPAELSGTGQDALVKPSKLKIVLSLSEPIYVISMKAFEAQP